MGWLLDERGEVYYSNASGSGFSVAPFDVRGERCP